jgi:glycosyltransferase involved in cell wall biosynthesis
LSEDRFVVIPNGVEIASVMRQAAQDSASDAAQATEGRLIASIGRLERYKGHHRIVEAMPQILARKPDARLWIAGKGPFERDLRVLADSLGIGDRVEIRAVPGGDRAAMAREVSATDLVVLLSEFETHPLSVLEAASLGCSVLVADSPGLRELAAAGLARSMPLDAPPARVAEAVVEQLEHPHVPAAVALPTWDECAEALLTLYRDVTGTR